jgi:hypothetical protein
MLDRDACLKKARSLVATAAATSDPDVAEQLLRMAEDWVSLSQIAALDVLLNAEIEALRNLSAEEVASSQQRPKGNAPGGRPGAFRQGDGSGGNFGPAIY